MAEDVDGAIWIPTLAGLYRVYENRVERVFPGSVEAGITRIAPHVFLATFAKAGGSAAEVRRIRQRSGRWTADVLLAETTAVRFQVDGAGRVLFGCEGGYCEFKSDDAVGWKPGSVLAITRHSIPTHANYTDHGATVLRDRLGCVWMRNPNTASYKCPGDRHPTTLSADIVSIGAPQILELKDGRIVMPGFGKVAIGRPGKFWVWTAQNGYPSTGYALVTRDGNLWFSNANGQFVMPMNLTIEFWMEHEGLEFNT
jgi:hypothetical protein